MHMAEVVAEMDVDGHTANSDDNGLSKSKNREPLWFCKLIASRPVTVFAVTLGCHVLLLLLTVLLIASGYDILLADFSGVPLNLEEDPTKHRADAWNFASDSGAVTVSQAKAGSQRTRGMTYQTLELIYELKGGNILTSENLRQIDRNEKEIFQNRQYQDNFCQLESGTSTSCKPPLSILRFFDGTYRKIHPNFYDPDYRNITQVLFTANKLNLTKAYLTYNLGKDRAFSHAGKTMVHTSYCRSLFYIGWPLDGYNNIQENKKEQTDKIDKHISTVFASTLKKKFESRESSMNFYYDNMALRREATQGQVVKDLTLAVFSFIFIILFMWFQTGSLWITSWATFSILSSFNISNQIYRILLDYRYFGIFHVLSIFIILGIGADDVFVFTDTWAQSEKEIFPSVAHRLSFVYRRAAKTMFITSFTTMVAFLSSVLSPLLAVSSFGVFSAVLIMVNYCSIVIFFPSVVFVHEQYRKGRCCCCTMCRSPSFPARQDEVDGTAAQEPTRNRKKTCEYIINFFQGVFFEKIVKHKVARFVILGCFVVVIAVSIVFAAKLEPQEEQVEIWGPNTNWAKVRYLRKTEFSTSQEDQVVKVSVIWGLRSQDRSECHHTDYKCRGRTVFDTSFDMNMPPCQGAVLDFCKKIKALRPDRVENLKLRRNEVTGEIEMECFVERMQEYFKEESKKGRYPPNSSFSLPLNSEKTTKVMEANPSLYDVSKLSENYYRYFEVGLGFFLSNGSKSGYARNYDYQKYGKYFGATHDIAASGTCDGKEVQDNKYGNRLLFMAIAVNTTLQASSLGYKSGLPIHDNWEKFLMNEMNTMPPACNKAFQATVGRFNTWHWLKVQKVLIKNAVQGIVTGLLLTLVVLVIATTNVYLGILATFTIAMVTFGVLATITILGWKLGVLESLNMTLVVGLSVDYVVHLAEGYAELEGDNRLSRTKHTLGHVAISVLSGACTTLGASVFMFASKISFFMQFGLFLFCTIGFSMLYSLLFFTTLLALIGPQQERGSILPAVRRVRDLIRGKTKDHVDCQGCGGKGFHPKPEEAIAESALV